MAGEAIRGSLQVGGGCGSGPAVSLSPSRLIQNLLVFYSACAILPSSWTHPCQVPEKKLLENRDHREHRPSMDTLEMVPGQ